MTGVRNMDSERRKCLLLVRQTTIFIESVIGIVETRFAYRQDA